MNNWDIYAIKYASATIKHNHISLESDFHNELGQLDYFIWVAQSDNKIVVIDTGFEASEGLKRGRTLIEDPVLGLEKLGILAEDVTDIIITHLHYDHAGNLNKYPNAKIHIQEKEMFFATGKCMCHERMRRPFSAEDIVEIIRALYQDKVIFHNGNYTLYPGLKVNLIGGHSLGLQVPWFKYENFNIVLASDALHLSCYLNNDDVFPLFGNYVDVIEGYQTLKKLAGENGYIIPGHDPSVCYNYPQIYDNIYHLSCQH